MKGYKKMEVIDKKSLRVMELEMSIRSRDGGMYG